MTLHVSCLFSFESSVLAFAHLGASFRVLQAISLAFTHCSKNAHAAPCAQYCYSAKGDSTLQGEENSKEFQTTPLPAFQMMGSAIFVCQSPDGDLIVSFLPQTSEELPDILGKQFRLLHGSEMATLWHLSPAHDIQAALRKCTRRDRNFFGKHRKCYRRLYAVGL
jgi:hypothetical protein